MQGEDEMDEPCEDWFVASGASQAEVWMSEVDEDLAEAMLSQLTVTEVLADWKMKLTRNACLASEVC